MKKVLVISSLVSGGAEKLLVRLADEWARRGDDVIVITLRSPRSDKYRLSDRVKRISFGADGLHWYSLIRYAKLLRRLRREIRRAKPDVVISFIIKTNILTLLATGGLPVPVIATEHSVIARSDISRRNGWLRRMAYRRAARIVVLTEAARTAIGKIVNSVPVVTIPNPLMQDSASADISDVDLRRYFPTSTRTDLRFIVGMGRLAPIKGFDMLLEAFAIVRRNNPEWRLVIVGEGEARPGLEALAAERGMQDVIAMPGFVTNAQAILRAADLFAAPSRFEGFGNAIIEAMAAGLPVVAFDCPDGPREIITDGHDGLLVKRDDTAALANAIQRLMDSAEERQRLAQAAALSVRRYDLERVLDMWDRMLAAS